MAKGIVKTHTPRPRPRGRPTDYKPEYAEKALEIMKKGKPLRYLAGVFSTTERTIYSWMENHPDFFHAVEQGKQLSFNHWFDHGHEGLYATHITNPDGTKAAASINARMYELMMSNMFDWSMKKSVEQSGEIKQVHDASELKALLEIGEDLKKSRK